VSVFHSLIIGEGW